MKEYDVFVAGVKHRPGAKEHLATLPEGTELTLQREPDNQFDANAIAIYSGEIQVGYIPSFVNTKIGVKLAGGLVDKVVFLGGTRIKVYCIEPTEEQLDG